MFRKNSNKINFKFSKFLSQNDLGTIPKITLSSFILVIIFYGMPLFIDYSKNKSNEFKNNELVLEIINFIEKDKKRPICTPFSK